jgi:hypothetical protein
VIHSLETQFGTLEAFLLLASLPFRLVLTLFLALKDRSLTPRLLS